MKTKTNPFIADYLDHVCSHVKAKGMHAEIRLELESHLTDLFEEKISEGMGEKEAIRMTILSMGDAETVGKQLHQIHKPKLEWSLMALVAVFLGVGLCTMYGLQLTFISSMVAKQTIATAIGITVMLAITFTDYRKLQPYSWHLYGVTALVMSYMLINNTRINGRPFLDVGSIKIDFVTLSPYLFIVSATGIILSRTWQFQGIVSKLGALVFLPSALYFFCHSNSSLVIYLVGLSVLIMFANNSRQEKRWFLATNSLLCLATWLSDVYLLEELHVWINPHEDPLGRGYIYIQSMEAIRSAGLWGNGLGAQLQTLPDITSDFKFTYVIHSLGWTGGLLIFLSIAIFTVRMAGVVRKGSDSYGKLLVVSLLTIFSISFFWPMLMTVGLLPVVELGMPFISYSSSAVIIQLATLGLIMSVYRRKDTIPRTRRTNTT